ncbi:MAG: hypothetical protein KIT16_23590, partial [Rhodospirillaceae bacterium]|nr:hypothetical protein [Rhodospirillaceae bacterium]
KTASVAAIDHEREMAAQQDADRNRAGLAVLAERRARAERDYQAAILGGDPARIAAARGELLDAAGVERRAQGDSPAEVNAGRRALESELRARAMRHRFAQLDDAGLDRALQEDGDAKADPAAAHRAVDDIRRIRREDPALAGAASVERVIEQRKRAGIITTALQEAEARTRLRLEAQAQRGIPEDRRQALTQDEKRSASAPPPDAAADPPASPAAKPSDPTTGGEAKTNDAGTGDTDYAERVSRHRAAARRWLRTRAGGTALADSLFDDIANAADAARAPGVSTAERVRILNATLAHVAAATKDDPRLGIFFTRAARSAFYIAARAPDAPAGDAVIKAAIGRSPAEAADAELAEENERDRAERQRSADAQYQRFKRDRPQAGYGDHLAEIQRIAAQTGMLPEGALRRLMPDLTPRDSSAISRLRDPRKVIAQLDALRTIAASGAASALPSSLRDLVGDYEELLSDPNGPRDPEELVYAVFRRGAPRRVQEVVDRVETAAEILTPYGNLVELNDARKAAVAAYDAFAAGRSVEGLQQSGDVLWHLAMAAPLIGNFKRGIKGVSAAGKIVLRPRSLREIWLEAFGIIFNWSGKHPFPYRTAILALKEFSPELIGIFIRDRGRGVLLEDRRWSPEQNALVDISDTYRNAEDPE